MSKQNTTLSPELEALLGASRSIQDLDLNSLEKSIRDQIYTLDDEAVVYPGHGPQTTVGQEIATNPFVNGG